MCERIHVAHEADIDAVVINAGAWTHYSYGIRDALGDPLDPDRGGPPLQHPCTRGFRHSSVFADVIRGQISGFGVDSYLLGLRSGAAAGATACRSTGVERAEHAHRGGVWPSIPRPRVRKAPVAASPPPGPGTGTATAHPPTAATRCGEVDAGIREGAERSVQVAGLVAGLERDERLAIAAGLRRPVSRRSACLRPRLRTRDDGEPGDVVIARPRSRAATSSRTARLRARCRLAASPRGGRGRPRRCPRRGRDLPAATAPGIARIG